jgi:hypothetical protein
LSDFHVDAEGGCVLDEVLAVAAVDPHLADAGVFGRDLVQEPGAGPSRPLILWDSAAPTRTGTLPRLNARPSCPRD